MKVVGYSRVSTNGQVTRGDSLEAQEEEIRAWADQHGHEVVAVCSEPGVSGANEVRDRPALFEARQLIRNGEADVLVVRNLGRLYRDEALQELFLREVWALGAQVISLNAEEQRFLDGDPTDPTRRFLRGVMGLVYEYEKAMIVQRTQGGRTRKRKKGGYVGERIAYGWRLEGEGKDACVVKVPRQQRVIQRIVALKDDGLSLNAIAERLNRAGTPPPSGRAWYPMTVKRIYDRKATQERQDRLSLSSS